MAFDIIDIGQKLINYQADMGTFNDELPERFRGGSFRRPQIGFGSSGRTTSSSKSVNSNIRSYVKSANISTDDPKEGWRVKSEIPTSEELLALDDEPVRLPTNKINRPWKSANRYLGSHYELLREDTVANLRDAVAAVRESPNRMDNNEISIYENVGLTLF